MAGMTLTITALVSKLGFMPCGFIAIVFSLPAAPLSPQGYSRRWRWLAVAAGAGLVIALGAVGWWRSENNRNASEAELVAAVPRQVTEGSFVSSASCRECHAQQYESWHASFHRQMAQVARPDTVLGPFDGSSIEFDGQRHRMVRRGDELWVESSISESVGESTDAEGDRRLAESGPRARRVVMTTGAHHMQLYWAASGAGNLLDELPVLFVRGEYPNEGRWAPLEASYLSPTPAGFNPETHWNTSCILCHSTGGNPRLDTRSGATSSYVAELGIACEACHGPGETHARLARARELDPADPRIVNPARLPTHRSAEVCGYCHAVASFFNDDVVKDFFVSGSPFRPGDDLRQTRATVLPARLTEEEKAAIRQQNPFFDGSFWPDGMVRIAGREYNGLVESACYQKGGMICLSCHSMHQSDPDDQLAASMQSNEACYQCHEPYRDKLANHTHHRESSRGSLCYNCHMPHTTYGLFKAIRSHQISSPNMAATLANGRPTACNLCHLDQTLAWTAEKLADWYGQPAPELDEDQSSLSAVAVLLLKGDPVQRVLAAWSAGWKPALDCGNETLAQSPAPAAGPEAEPNAAARGSQWLAPVVAQLLDDESPVIRLVASRSLRGLNARYAIHFDFAAPPQQRAPVAAQIVDRWEQLPLAERGPVEARLLRTPEGRLNRSLIERLLDQRDQRRTPVNE